MVTFGRKKISLMNKKIFLGLRMQEKHLKRLRFEPTIVLDYSKSLSNFRGHFRGQGRTGQGRNLFLHVRNGKDYILDLVSALQMFAQKP